MAMELNVKGIDFSKLTAEQITLMENELSAKFGTEIKLVADKKKEKLGALENKLDADGNFICAHCGKVENYNAMSEDNQALARKYGVCLTCLESIKVTEAIKAIAPKRTVIRSGESAADIAKGFVKQYAGQITAAFMTTSLMDKAWCAKEMKLHYPLFIEKPANISADADDLKALVTDNKGKRRFGAVEYTFPQIPGKVYLMTNDLYKDKVNKIGDAFEAFVSSQIVKNEVLEDVAKKLTEANTSENEQVSEATISDEKEEKASKTTSKKSAKKKGTAKK